jgi:exopolysaccharide biosynthesis polyprenyl glycosylphosphotransferase
MIRRHARSLQALLVAADALLAAGLLVVLSYLRFGAADWAIYWRQAVREPLVFVALYAVGWVAVLWFHGLYRPRARWSIGAEVGDILRATVVMAFASFSVLFIFKLPDVSRLFLLLLFPAQAVLALGTRATLRVAFERLRRRGLNARFVLVVGAGRRGQRFAEQISAHHELGLRVTGFLDDEVGDPLPNDWRLLGRLEDLQDVLHHVVIDEVAICLPFSMWDMVDAIAQMAMEEGKIVRVPMDVLDRAFAAGRMEELDGIPVFSLISGPDRLVGLIVKRTLDVVISAVALVVLSPIALAIALWIRSVDGTPVLFRQVRVGLHGRPFDVAKFRTMVKDAEARYGEVVGLSDPRAFKLADDPRITPPGRFLRRTSLDELPQLWNVLRGEMSLVGPRPAPPREVEGYDVWHRRRLSMKPGITGLWQVTARSDDSFERRATLDLDYIDRWSLLLDMKILARTIPAALDGR